MTSRKVLYAKPSITDREIRYVTDAVTHGWGEDCYAYLHRFRETLCDHFAVPHAWPTSSCHGALHIALCALDIGPGDEVIVPDITWIGSVAPIVWVGATPVFVDVLPDTWCIDPAKIEAAVTPRTKAILAVHLYGNVCAMEAIQAIAARHGLPLIEDAAEAVGSRYGDAPVGSLGDFGVFSFHGTKTITTGEGGALLSRREDLADRVTLIESQGRSTDKQAQFWVDAIGLKYKMSNIQAALGLAQLERVQELVDRKRAIFEAYADRLRIFSDIYMNVEPGGTVNGYWMPAVVFGESWRMTLAKRNALLEALNRRDVAVRPFFYPVSRFPMFADHPQNRVSYGLYARGINLPSSFDMTPADVDHVCTMLQDVLADLGTK